MERNNNKKIIKRIVRLFIIVFVLMNIIAIFHSYKFTHFSDKIQSRTDTNKLTASQKAGILFFGINNPRPVNTKKPSQPYQNIKLKSNVAIECWSIKVPNSKGTIILFHGYGGKKSDMLDKSDEFLKLGYNTLLVDFMGSGGSEGNTTTIGYFEAQQVKTCYDYLKTKGENNIHLFGTSMGSAAILKAIKDYNLSPKSILLECPFGSMYKTVCARFRIMKAPTFPMAGLLMFWGGIQNGFWAFNNNPEEYAAAVNCPTLLLYGNKDNRVSREETDTIFKNIKGKKKLVIFHGAGHENYLVNHKEQWVTSITAFMKNI